MFLPHSLKVSNAESDISETIPFLLVFRLNSTGLAWLNLMKFWDYQTGYLQTVLVLTFLFDYLFLQVAMRNTVLKPI
jgi:hypothetical protein